MLPSSCKVAARYRSAIDLSGAPDEEIEKIAKFLAGQVDSMDDKSVAYGAYVGTAIPAQKFPLVRPLIQALMLSYRKRLVKWFEHALVKRANLGGGGSGIKKVEEGLASFVQAIPEVLSGNRNFRLSEYLPDTEYFVADRLDPVANRILSVVREDAIKAGVLQAGRQAARISDFSVEYDPRARVWFIPPTDDTYPHRREIRLKYGFDWNRSRRRWEVSLPSPAIKRDFKVKDVGETQQQMGGLQQWFLQTWLPKNINRFTKVFTTYARSAQASYDIVFTVSGGKVKVKFARNISTAQEAVEELRYRYLNRHGREPWLEVMDKFIELVGTKSLSQLPLIIDRINNLQHSNGLFMEHFPSDVKSWYDGFLNAKYNTPTPDELAKFIPDRDLRGLLIEVAKMRRQPKDWQYTPPPAYDKMTKELEDLSGAVNWRAKGYPRYRKSIQVDRFDPAVQSGLDILKKLHEQRESLLSTKVQSNDQLVKVQDALVDWTTDYSKALDSAKKALEAQRMQELQTPGYAAAWEARNFPEEFLERFPYSVPGVSRSQLAPFLVRYGTARQNRLACRLASRAFHHFRSPPLDWEAAPRPS
jgi:hypothetical protein